MVAAGSSEPPSEPGAVICELCRTRERQQQKPLGAQTVTKLVRASLVAKRDAG